MNKAVIVNPTHPRGSVHYWKELKGRAMPVSSVVACCEKRPDGGRSVRSMGGYAQAGSSTCAGWQVGVSLIRYMA